MFHGDWGLCGTLGVPLVLTAFFGSLVCKTLLQTIETARYQGLVHDFFSLVSRGYVRGNWLWLT